jgi:hypothetical protein
MPVPRALGADKEEEGVVQAMYIDRTIKRIIRRSTYDLTFKLSQGS